MSEVRDEWREVAPKYLPFGFHRRGARDAWWRSHAGERVDVSDLFVDEGEAVDASDLAEIRGANRDLQAFSDANSRIRSLAAKSLRSNTYPRLMPTPTAAEDLRSFNADLKAGSWFFVVDAIRGMLHRLDAQAPIRLVVPPDGHSPARVVVLNLEDGDRAAWVGLIRDMDESAEDLLQGRIEEPAGACERAEWLDEHFYRVTDDHPVLRPILDERFYQKGHGGIRTNPSVSYLRRILYYADALNDDAGYLRYTPEEYRLLPEDDYIRPLTMQMLYELDEAIMQGVEPSIPPLEQLKTDGMVPGGQYANLMLRGTQAIQAFGVIEGGTFRDHLRLYDVIRRRLEQRYEAYLERQAPFTLHEYIQLQHYKTHQPYIRIREGLPSYLQDLPGGTPMSEVDRLRQEHEHSGKPRRSRRTSTGSGSAYKDTPEGMRHKPRRPPRRGKPTGA
ncbi:hypothetical protein EMO89_00215 [Bifidobacterium tissieri]|nr:MULTISPECIES: hypothetical protein [Bifidobacterium]KAA8831988.1 hypothetical protein EMO89_00215 [Bifidobacterium tissieri]